MKRVLLIAVLCAGVACSHDSSSPPAAAPKVDLQMRPVIQLVDAHARTWRVLRPTCHGSATVVADCMASMHGTDRVTLRVGSRKYVLGPVVVDDAGVTSANAIDTTANGNGSAVELRLTPAATQALAAATQQVVAAPAPRNEMAMLVDGAIVSAPTVQTLVTSGAVQITGGFTAERAKAIAAGLNASA